MGYNECLLSRTSVNASPHETFLA